MRNRRLYLWPILSLALLTFSACGLVGPNTFSTRGTVLNPLHDHTKDDAEIARPPQVLVIRRKETRVQVKHTIVGPQQRPMALKLLGEFCEIVPDKATPSRLIFQCLLFSNYRDELAEMKQEFHLTLPDGRRIEGRFHMKYPMQDHTIKITGAHMEPYLVVRDRENKTIKHYSAVKEVENDFELFSRAFKVVFEAKDLISLTTPYVILVIDGYQRRWTYRYDFTNDPEAAMRWWVTHMEH